MKTYTQIQDEARRTFNIRLTAYKRAQDTLHKLANGFLKAIGTDTSNARYVYTRDSKNPAVTKGQPHPISIPMFPEAVTVVDGVFYAQLRITIIDRYTKDYFLTMKCSGDGFNVTYHDPLGADQTESEVFDLNPDDDESFKGIYDSISDNLMKTASNLSMQ